MNSITICVKAQVNKLSIHITMFQRRQEKDYKDPFGKANHYLRRLLKTVRLLCCRKREKVMRSNCKFSFFLQTLRYLLQMTGFSTFSIFSTFLALPELLFLGASTDSVHRFSACPGTRRLCVNPAVCPKVWEEQDTRARLTYSFQG